jgi:tellurite resistance protein
VKQSYPWPLLLDHFLFLYLVKIVAAPHESSELADPVQCCFIGLIGVATMIEAMGLLPRSRTVAEVLPRCVRHWAFSLHLRRFAPWRT